MNKKEMILTEAKRLSGTYGYLGFTLKQLAQACDMTAPALYYFYSSKAELFKDCLISELEIRHVSVSEIALSSLSIQEFAERLAIDSIDKCGASNFRTGRAMQEIVHLPGDIQQELRDAWDRLLIMPVEDFLARIETAESPVPSRYLRATFLIDMATFVASQVERFSRDELLAVLITAACGMEERMLTPAGV